MNTSEKKRTKNGKGNSGPSIESAGEKINAAVLVDADIAKETIREWLVKDMRGSLITLNEVLNSKECIDALLEIFWKRYSDLHKAKVEQPELNLNQE